MTFIRPFLEFAVPVWSPILKSDCDLMERIQHRATKLVSSLRNQPYERRLENLGITTLTKRRQRGDVIQLYKIIHEIDQFDRSDRFPLVNNQVRGHRYKFFKEITKHQFRENFFFNRVANLWNSLPYEVVEAPTVNSFKARFDSWMNSNQSNQL